MSVVIAGVIAIGLGYLADLLLHRAIIAGILGTWGLFIAFVGILAVLVIWVLGLLD